VGARLLGRPVDERRAAAVDHVVDENRGDDLSPQWVLAYLVAKSFDDQGWEIRTQDAVEPRLIGQCRIFGTALQDDLRIVGEDGLLRRGHPLCSCLACGYLLVRR